MNTSDSERIATLLEQKGYKHSSTPDGADLVIISVCSVKQKPIDRIKNQIITLKRERKNSRVVLTGCILPQDKEMFKKLGAEIKDFNEIEDIMPKEAFIPITRGCNNFCTYCAVPYTKGREKHRSEEKILLEAKQLIKKGHKKIMLLGQNVNSYPDFTGLLKKVTAQKGDFTVEFMSNHPKDFSDELIEEMACNPKLENYVHLPYQSGDNEILKRMNRKYTRQHYLKLINKIKKAIPDVRITTDAIVGFPGETEEQFQHTVSVAKEVGFLQIYINKYSPRAGTPAANLKDNVTMEEKKRREKILRATIKKHVKK